MGGRCFRRYFDCKRVEEINAHIDSILRKKGMVIDNWQYCADCDSAYAKSHPDLGLDPFFVKDKTTRKPGTAMVTDGLKELGKDLKSFGHILVIGDRHEDGALVEALGGAYVDVNDKGYDDFLKEFS